ncbi:hypothetical protein ETH98_04320 [Macrococcoides caseolyticum]|uniref:hypothetical protein n=1 Tax=Macrococcoides caseolyticum TaxID=69966 RepID=UPI0010619292|nr:hypothetical protein [Macrococcus caseolyticus]TDM29921.1 hypothetical protein ETH98_04320 [Macrococcus caseolyticus]
MQIKKLISFEVNNIDRWRDPYDTEEYSSRYLRAILKRIQNFAPELLYKLKVLKSHEWDENYILLGIATLNLQMEEELDKILKKLTIKKEWGLPIDWHSGKYKFPRGSLMSTTTSENILFLCDVYEKYPEKLNTKYLKDIGENLLNTLNKVYLNEDEYLFSYTKFDKYKVINSNLLVCAALKKLFEITKNNVFYEEYNKVYNTILKRLPTKGYIPYFIDGGEETADSYHQLFCLRSFFILEETNYKIYEEYFEKNFVVEKGVLFKAHLSYYDLQGLSEGIRYYGITNNESKFLELKNKLSYYYYRDRLIQRFLIKNKFIIKYKSLHSRQGFIRLLCALSYEK